MRVGLGHAAERLADCLAQSAKAELPGHAFLDRLLDIELYAAANTSADRAIAARHRLAETAYD